jgi:hypothetical protein
MKLWYESKTVWFNLVMTLLMIVPVVATTVKALDPNDAVLIDAIAGLVTGVGNIIIRIWFTDMPIGSAAARG